MKPVTTLRVATLNLWNDVKTWAERLPALIHHLDEFNPDVFCVQENVVYSDGGSMLGDVVAALGEPWRVISEHGWTEVPGGLSGVGMAARFEGDDVAWVDLPGLDQGNVNRRLLSAVFTHPAGRCVVGTSHLAWGGSCEAVRLQQALAIDRYYESRYPMTEFGGQSTPVVFCGDFNTTPPADTLRFFRGEAVVEGVSTYWMDAWVESGDGSEGFTQVPENKWVQEVFRWVGIDGAAPLPSGARRRIDYILTRGWSWGRPGLPVSTQLFGATPVAGVFPSDHFGLVADIALEATFTQPT